MTSEAGGVRLGDLLTQAGLLRQEELREAMQIAKHQSLPVGRVLIMSGFLSDGQLRAAVQAQSLLKDGVIGLEIVLKALSLVGGEEMALEEAFRQLGYDVQQSQPTNKLGELLIESGLVTRELLDQALQQSNTSGLPLGRILLLTGTVLEPLLSSALNAQVLVRDHKISREQAIQGLRSAKERQITLEQSLSENGLQLPLHNTIRLGELLIMAGIMSDTNLMDYVELGLVSEQPLGQILIAQSVITEHILSNALELQRMVANGSLIAQQAALVLNTVATSTITIQDVLKAQEPQPQPAIETVPLYQLLQLAGRITPQQIEEAVRTGTRDAQIMGLMLNKIGAIDEFQMSVALALNDFMAKGIVSVEQAIVALNYCITQQTSLETAFTQMGWFLNQPYDSYTTRSGVGTDGLEVLIPVTDPVYSHAPVDPHATAQLPPVTPSELHMTQEEFDREQAQQTAPLPPTASFTQAETSAYAPAPPAQMQAAPASQSQEGPGTPPDGFMPPPPPGYTPLPAEEPAAQDASTPAQAPAAPQPRQSYADPGLAQT
ncbi:MAG: hypothetical protein IAF58_08595, partial [Leptolyngbya sp.]|nr:hypothetical protein [Candidatus Melainabacteria bacterium]